MVKSEETANETTVVSLAFRWSYIVLPLLILVLSIILTAYFYRLLPDEVAYHFASDGSPDRWLSRGMIALWAILPQILFTLAAGAISWGTVRLAARIGHLSNAWIKPEKILMLMGNMIALPQIIICFAILDIFSYNSYQIRLLPLWVFALIVMGLGGIILGIFFIQAIRRALQTAR